MMFFAVPVVELMLVALLVEVTLVAVVLVEVHPCNITVGGNLKVVTAGVDDEVFPAFTEFDNPVFPLGPCAENHQEISTLLHSNTE